VNLMRYTSYYTTGPDGRVVVIERSCAAAAGTGLILGMWKREKRH
jgi:hypothetical protein